MNPAEKQKRIVFHYFVALKNCEQPSKFDWLLADLGHINNPGAEVKVKKMMWDKAQSLGIGYNHDTKKFYKE